MPWVVIRRMLTKIAMGSYGKMEREVIKDTGITFGAKMGQLSG